MWIDCIWCVKQYDDRRRNQNTRNKRNKSRNICFICVFFSLSATDVVRFCFVLFCFWFNGWCNYLKSHQTNHKREKTKEERTKRKKKKKGRADNGGFCFSQFKFCHGFLHANREQSDKMNKFNKLCAVNTVSCVLNYNYVSQEFLVTTKKKNRKTSCKFSRIAINLLNTICTTTHNEIRQFQLICT